MPAKNNLLGQKFGRLLVLSEAGRIRSSVSWLCRCDCGIEKEIIGSHLLSGNTKSCGCYQKERVRESNIKYKDNEIHSLTYNSWYNMKTRCTNPKSTHYDRYGGRGISICDRWSDFSSFLEDMGERPLGTSLDRINNDGNYTKHNCRWATNKEQAKDRLGSKNPMSKLDTKRVNTIKNMLVEGKLSQKSIAEKFGVSQSIISRINLGKVWSRKE